MSSEFQSPEDRQTLIDELIKRQKGGDAESREALWNEIYSEVRRMARSVLVREGPLRPIDTSVLVHDLYLKLGGATFDNRAHFFGSLVRMMGQIIIDAARTRARTGRREAAVAVTTTQIGVDTPAIGLAHDESGQVAAAVIEALDRLDSRAPRSAAVAWLRFVSGLSVEQVATCLGISERTVKSDWRFARAWLYRELTVMGLKPVDRKSTGGSDDE